MIKELKDIIFHVKSSFTVEGVPIIKSDRFTQEEYDTMKAASKAHSSHWLHLAIGQKVWSDDEISAQITTFFDQSPMTREKFKVFNEAYFKAIKYENYDKEFDDFKTLLYGVLGWDTLTPLDVNFWSKFSSAPNSIAHDHRNIGDIEKGYGALGMHDIFGEIFSSRYFIPQEVTIAFNNFKGIWVENAAFKKLKETTFSSPFKSLDDLEENVTVKNIANEAKNFYMDRTKPFEERIKAFNAHGKEESYIHQPSNMDLKKIFEMYSENDVERHRLVYVMDILEWWVECFYSGRLKLNWANPYHPKLVVGKRNYKLSQEAIDRLYRYYAEILMIEGISKFTFDW